MKVLAFFTIAALGSMLAQLWYKGYWDGLVGFKGEGLALMLVFYVGIRIADGAVRWAWAKRRPVADKNLRGENRESSATNNAPTE